MRIGLIDIEPNIFNTAYMQIAGHYVERNDEVDWWSPLTDRQFDYVFCSSIFTFTDRSEVPARAICGGTGYDVSSRLSIEIENSNLDYSIYPKCRTSYIWFSRGCKRKCGFCVVPEKEGGIKSVERKNLNALGEYITVCDNNFFANPDWEKAIRWLRDWGQSVDFQGVDARDSSIHRCEQLLSLRHKKLIKIGWDNPRENLKPKLREIIKTIRPGLLLCYVLIGYDSTEAQDLHRVETLRELEIRPFAMPFDKKDPYQKAFCRWVNRKAVFYSCKWSDYKYHPAAIMP